MNIISTNDRSSKLDKVEKSSVSNLHSITFYIPSTKIEHFTNALKTVSSEIYGNEKRNVSRYIRDLIYIDLQKRGFLDSNMNPIEK